MCEILQKLLNYLKIPSNLSKSLKVRLLVCNILTKTGMWSEVALLTSIWGADCANKVTTSTPPAVKITTRKKTDKGKMTHLPEPLLQINWAFASHSPPSQSALELCLP